MKSRSNLERVLAAGHFALTGELGPPQSASAEVIRKKAEYYKGCADAVNITDNQTAIVRMSSIASAAILVGLGLDPIMQMTCRDRNRIAMQSDILGAYALGINNILCLTGDHQSFGNHPTSKNVYDLDSIQLIRMVRTMRDEKRFLSGDELKAEPKMFIGAAENPFADPFEYRVVRLAKKVAAGADFIQTQAVFDIPRFSRWMEMVRDRGLHERVYILAGVIPVKSARALEYMKNEVPGMSVPDELIRRMEAAADPKEEGVRIAVETIQQLREIPGVAGIHLMPMMWEAIAPVVAERAGLLPRPAPPAAGLAPASEGPPAGA
ncbi:MAG: methylenetetrahydrofolate reductase [Bacillota bacterium]|nr:methylenetetrahydrofolate reductase [Bacillota bacterium]